MLYAQEDGEDAILVQFHSRLQYKVNFKLNVNPKIVTLIKPPICRPKTISAGVLVKSCMYPGPAVLLHVARPPVG